jgi:putative ABC transport system permease protein
LHGEFNARREAFVPGAARCTRQIRYRGMRHEPAPLRPPSIAALAWRQTLRDFRAGELRLLAVAVMLAVAALTAVGFFADRLGSGLQRDARQLLGGDAVVGSDQPAPATGGARRRHWACAWPPARASPAWAARPTTRAAPRAWWR